MPMKVGIVGCGVIAPTHVQSYQLQDDVEVTWGCDLVVEKAERLAETFDIPHTTADVREMLCDGTLDAISVCTDHASHADVAVAALEAGKHVLCEKALAATIAGLDRMEAARRQHPELTFSAVFQHRFDPLSRVLQQCIREEAFGHLLTAGVQMRCLRTLEYYRGDDWRGTWAQEGGAVLINQAIHYIDLLAWLCGGVAAVSGRHANLTHGSVMETEDTAVSALEFRGGALGTIEATCSSHITWEPTLSFHGTRGSLDLRHDRILKLDFDDKNLEARVRSDIEAACAADGVNAAKSYYGTGHPAQIADFVDAVRNGRPPFVTIPSARHTVELVLSIYRSHRERRWIELPGDDGPMT